MTLRLVRNCMILGAFGCAYVQNPDEENFNSFYHKWIKGKFDGSNYSLLPHVLNSGLNYGATSVAYNLSRTKYSNYGFFSVVKVDSDAPIFEGHLPYGPVFFLGAFDAWWQVPRLNKKEE
ncbi:hypothetical protein PROFUN_04915 [Planoprotostelium fungivorum]|uniref:Uncharacterized protein n=1 Tax=Planoprotostelium fungivorum TaxID=1890364 RepID=A0A2P6MWW1_9EUKA|nr:hypothetical protein PROFUN_15376 [Planoprotostelium fungivorum]PRP82610.1 hypothetical protein PROFUN_04915 [Planoprotostelium fungivorum]